MDYLLNLYIRATVKPVKMYDWSGEPTPVEMPALWQIMILPMLILLVAALVF